MFFSEDLLTRKKGTFGVIWLAATLGPRTKRITRKELTAVDLPRSCELIAQPPEPLALRLSGCLLVGVARLYNQNYEIFYTDVNQCQIAIRRSFATEFSAAGGSGGISAGVDMIGDGKSKFDQITYSDLDIGMQTGFDFDSGFAFINWLDPLGKLKIRRSTSKLDSLPSQRSQIEESSEDEELDSQTEDDSQLPVRREKRSKIDSSPLHGAAKIGSKGRGYLSERSPLGDALDPDFNFPIDEAIDLNLFPDISNDSISGPVGGDFDLPLDDAVAMDHGQMDVEMPFLPDQAGRESTLAPGTDGQLIASAIKKRKTGEESDDSASEIGKDLEKMKKRKRKAKKQARFDPNIEIPDADTNTAAYQANMDAVQESAAARETERKISDQAAKLIHRSGIAVDFFDHDLDDLFAEVTKIEMFKWERDVQAHRQGKELTFERRSPMPQIKDRNDVDLGVAQPLQNDVFANNNEDYALPQDYNDFTNGLYEVGVPRGSMAPARTPRESQQSQHTALPWQDVAFGRGQSDDFLPAGADSSFTPQTLRLSIMTPQELTIRRQSRHTASSGIGIGRNRLRSRSLTGSILGQRDEHPRMLIDGDDDELPPDEIQLEITESQVERRANIPEAFQPQMLASLEIQCRDFLAYIEQTLLDQAVDSVVFEDLAPTTSSRRVGASAFYNCLTLATKRCLTLEQESTFAPISIRLTA